VCNLGSINISEHITREGGLDKESLAKTVKTAIRMLDNVIDINKFPFCRISQIVLEYLGAGKLNVLTAIGKNKPSALNVAFTLVMALLVFPNIFEDAFGTPANSKI